MASLDLAQATTTGLKTGVPDFKVSPRVIDEAGVQDETYWTNPNWTTYLGYLKSIPEYRNAVRALAIWACGKGWTSPSNETTAQLDRITGWGEDSFDSIMQDMIVVKKTNGDAYAEIIRNDNGTLINLKKLNPSKIRHVVDPKGLILRYDLMQADGEWHEIKTTDIFHICNDRIANEIHGTSVLESCKGIIDWFNEIMSDLRRMMHRSSVRVIYIDMDDTTKLGTVKEQYKEAIKNGEVLILPGKRGVDAEIVDYSIPPTAAYLDVLRFVNNYFYEVLGTSKIITGGVEGTTEANSKMGYLSFEQPYMTEQRLLEQDLWNQLAIKVKFNRPVSLKDEMQTSEAANTGQTGFQPTDFNAQVGRVE